MHLTKKIRILSQIFRAVAIFDATGTLVSGVSRWIAAPFSVLALPSFSRPFIPTSLSAHFPPLRELPASLKAIGLLDYATPIVAKVSIYIFLYLLFTEYSKGRIFSNKALLFIRNIGYVILVGTGLLLLYSFITYAILPHQVLIEHKQSQGILIYGPLGYSLRFITAGLFILCISWIIRVGKTLETEQKHTVR